MVVLAECVYAGMPEPSATEMEAGNCALGVPGRLFRRAVHDPVLTSCCREFEIPGFSYGVMHFLRYMVRGKGYAGRKNVKFVLDNSCIKCDTISGTSFHAITDLTNDPIHREGRA